MLRRRAEAYEEGGGGAAGEVEGMLYPSLYIYIDTDIRHFIIIIIIFSYALIIFFFSPPLMEGRRGKDWRVCWGIPRAFSREKRKEGAARKEVGGDDTSHTLF